MRSANIRYLPQVDHLRAVAAIWIVLYHSMLYVGPAYTGFQPLATNDQVPTLNPLYALWIEGHTAVAMFMTLSGFIFTVGAYGKTISYGRFILNRLLRIYPLYLAIMFALLADDRDTIAFGRVITAILPLADFNWADKPFHVYLDWSVAVEFQFYLLFPFILRFFNRNPIKATAGVIAAAFTFRLIQVGLWVSPRDLSYWHLVGRIDQFMLGMLAAYAYHRFQGRAWFFRTVFCVAVPFAVCLLWAYQAMGGFSSEANWKILWPTVEGGAWAAVIVGYVGLRQSPSALLGRAAAWVGAMSFSIYLLHAYVLRAIAKHPSVTLHLFGNWQLDALATAVLVGVPIILAMSAVTYNTIEKPFLSLRVKYITGDDVFTGAHQLRRAPLEATPQRSDAAAA